MNYVGKRVEITVGATNTQDAQKVTFNLTPDATRAQFKQTLAGYFSAQEKAKAVTMPTNNAKGLSMKQMADNARIENKLMKLRILTDVFQNNKKNTTSSLFEYNPKTASIIYPATGTEVSVKYSVSVSNIPKNHRAEMAMLNALTSIKGQPIQDLAARDNVLTFEAGAYYRLLLNSNQYMIVTGRGGTCTDVPIDHIAEEYFSGDCTIFTTETYNYFKKMQDFFEALNDETTWGLRSQFTQQEVLENCAKLGIKAGDWVEVYNAGHKNRFYLCENGIPWPEGSIEQMRLSFATKDWRLDGCTADSVFIINGKEYKMDENGHVNIPKGELVIWGYNVTVPKKIC